MFTKLFGLEEPTTRPGTNPEEERARVFYKDPVVAALADSSAPAAQRLYPVDHGLNRTIVENLDQLGDRTGLTVAQRRTEHEGYLAMVRQIDGLPEDSTTAGLLIAEHIQARRRLALPSTDAEQEARAKQITLSNETNRRTLISELGAEEYERQLGYVRGLTARSPKLKEILEDPEATINVALWRSLLDFARRNEWRTRKG